MKKFFVLFVVLCLTCSLVSAPCLAFEELSKGSKGDAVVELQNRLNELGYNIGKADGIYGKKTVSAVKAFQELNELEVTGTVDAVTYECLFSDDAVQPTPSPTPKPTNTPKPTKTPKPAKTPKPTESGLLSEKECLKRANNYVKRNYPGWKQVWGDPEYVTSRKKFNICYSLSNGVTWGFLNLEIDRETGSITVVK